MASNYPHWFKRAPQIGSLPIGELKWKVWNRSGGATVKGEVYQFDLGFTTTSTTETSATDGLLSAVTTMLWGNSESAWRNIVLPATAFLRQGIFCRADAAVADNEPLTVTVLGPTSVTNSTTAVGDGTVTTGYQHFEPVNGAATLSYTTSATSTSRLVFMSTESFVIASSAIASVNGMFNGFGF